MRVSEAVSSQAEGRHVSWEEEHSEAHNKGSKAAGDVEATNDEIAVESFAGAFHCNN